jgi:thiamine biosynthesis lipoprotein ApbE
MILLDGYEGLGTKFWIEVFEDITDENFVIIESRIKGEIDNFGARYSRFRSDSILNKLNRERSINLNNSEDFDLINMLQISMEYYSLTNHTFDIFIKEKLENLGYGASDALLMGNSSEYASANFQSSAADISNNVHAYSDVDTKARPTLIITGGDVYSSVSIVGEKSIDLGGIGKGYLIQKISNILEQEFKLKYYIVNGGGDMYVTSNGGTAIDLYLEHPTNIGEYIYKIKLKDSALCVSSSFKRSWNRAGKMVNHFITKEDTPAWSASYIVGRSAAEADMAATVACIDADNADKLKNDMHAFGVDYLVLNSSESKRGD